jgi:hypothetical protein
MKSSGIRYLQLSCTGNPSFLIAESLIQILNP